MLLAASVIPMALIGGIFALCATGTAFSVSAAIGFVALFGIAAMDGIIVLTSYNATIDEGLDRTAAILWTCHVQMRPVLVVVGGIMLASVLILVILPVLIDVFSRRASPEAVEHGLEPAE